MEGRQQCVQRNVIGAAESRAGVMEPRSGLFCWYTPTYLCVRGGSRDCADIAAGDRRWQAHYAMMHRDVAKASCEAMHVEHRIFPSRAMNHLLQ